MDLLALQRPQEGDEAVVSVLMSDVAAGDQSVWLDSFGFLASVCTGLIFIHHFFWLFFLYRSPPARAHSLWELFIETVMSDLFIPIGEVII